jgi:hypothetical protein
MSLADLGAHREAVFPVDFTEQVISGRLNERVRAYMASPTQVYYVMHIAGSWFPRSSGPQTT